MKMVPYLVFQGQCREAMEFYARTLGGRIDALFTFADTPAGEQSPPEQQHLVMHARLVVGEGVLMASDSPPEHYQAPAGTSVSLHPETPEEAERIYHALAEGGSVSMPIQETFWAARFAMVTDRFGTPWMINCELPGG